MKSVYKFARRSTARHSLAIERELSRVHKYRFSIMQEEVKNPEISESDQESFSSPLPALPEEEVVKFRTRKLMEKRSRRDAALSNTKHSRFHDNSEIFSASSVHEIDEYLNELTRNRLSVKSDQSHIMDLLDSLVSETPIDADSDAATVNATEDHKSSQSDLATVANAYAAAVRKCGFMREWQHGYKLVEDAKRMKVASPKVYAALIWLKMEESPNFDTLNECFEIYEDLQTKKTALTPLIFCELIKSCINMGAFGKADRLVKLIENESHPGRKRQFMDSYTLRNVIMHYFASTQNVKRALLFMNSVTQELGAEALSELEFTGALSCIASAMEKDASLIAAAEKLFERSLKHNPTPRAPLFVALINCYGHVPDIGSCLECVENMYNNEQWPMPDENVFTAVLRVLTRYYHHPLDAKEGWEYLGNVLNMMERQKIEYSEHTFAALFRLCGGGFCGQSNMKRLHKYYEMMIKKGIKLNQRSASALLTAGFDHHKLRLEAAPEKKESIKKNLMKHVEWVSEECNKYNIKFSARHRQIFESKVHELFEIQDELDLTI